MKRTVTEIQLTVEDLCKQWIFTEAIYHPEYNGIDEEVEAAEARKMYQGAALIAGMVTGREFQSREFRQACMEGLVLELRQEIQAAGGVADDLTTRALEALTEDADILAEMFGTP